jgi:hypothetical protein
MKNFVHTVCGQPYPHQSRPARFVKKNNPNAPVISSHERRMKSCGQNVMPKTWKRRAGRSSQTACRSP